MNTKTVKNWWETWDIQVVTLISLLLQITLTICAPLRKRVSKAPIVFPIWLAYLLADASPVYALGLISRRTSGSSTNNADNLVVFWAPFLLVHLGGPDTITAFSLEDNELWKRHVINLVVQCGVVVYAFYLSFPGNELWFPTVLMFVAGFMKYTERTCSLYLASLRGLRNSLRKEPDPGHNYGRLMDEFASNLEAGLPTTVYFLPGGRVTKTESNDEGWRSLTDLEVIQRAHQFHETSKALLADVKSSLNHRTDTRKYFLKRDARDGFRIVEVELNFFYEILYTKALVVQSKYGFLIRIASFSFTCITLALFLLMNKHERGYKIFDVGFTYSLLGSAILLDALSFRTVLLSNWTAAFVSDPVRYQSSDTYMKLEGKFKQFMRKILRIESEGHVDPPSETNPSEGHSTFSLGQIKQIAHRSWCKSISQYNFLDYCLRPRSSKVERIIGPLGLTHIFDSLKYVKSKGFSHQLRDLIFDELKMKSGMASDLKTTRDISSARGDWTLHMLDCHTLLPWIEDFEYDESLLIWHIATELLYNTDEVPSSSSTDSNASSTEPNFRELSKLLSDYMLYLMVMQTTIMSTAAGINQTAYRDTCAEAKSFFSQRGIGEADDTNNNLVVQSLANFLCCSFKTRTWRGEIHGEDTQDKVVQEACEHIFGVNRLIHPYAVNGGTSKSVLFVACFLAERLKDLDEDDPRDKKDPLHEKKDKRWMIVCRVLIEMMCYAACHCRGTTHAAELSKGGELINLVWLLMAHFGLMEYFQVDKSGANAKLVSGK